MSVGDEPDVALGLRENPKEGGRPERGEVEARDAEEVADDAADDLRQNVGRPAQTTWSATAEKRSPSMSDGEGGASCQAVKGEMVGVRRFPPSTS